MNFVFAGPFSAVWGAVPGVDFMQVRGKITAGAVNEDGTLRQVEDEVPAPVVLVEEDAAVLTQRVERGRGIRMFVGTRRCGQRTRERRDHEHRGDG